MRPANLEVISKALGRLMLYDASACKEIALALDELEEQRAQGAMPRERPAVCEHRDWTDEDNARDAPFPSGPMCGALAAWLACTPKVDMPVCCEHKCRCNKPLRRDNPKPTKLTLGTRVRLRVRREGEIVAINEADPDAFKVQWGPEPAYFQFNRSKDIEPVGASGPETASGSDDNEARWMPLFDAAEAVLAEWKRDIGLARFAPQCSRLVNELRLARDGLLNPWPPRTRGGERAKTEVGERTARIRRQQRTVEIAELICPLCKEPVGNDCHDNLGDGEAIVCMKATTDQIRAHAVAEARAKPLLAEMEEAARVSQRSPEWAKAGINLNPKNFETHTASDEMCTRCERVVGRLDDGTSTTDSRGWCTDCQCAEHNACDAAPSPAELHAAGQALLRMMWLYPHYNVRSRGPIGCLHEALKVLAPRLQKRLEDGEEPEDLLDPDPHDGPRTGQAGGG